jgi:hypothetical protein
MLQSSHQLEDYINKKRMVRRKCLCSPDQKIKSRSRVQEGKSEDTYAVRVEGRSKEGFISFTK